MLYKDEAQALDDESLSHVAKLIYLGVFYRNVDHNTALACVKMRQMIDFVRYIPTPGSVDKSIMPTRQNIRTALKKLENVGLIELVYAGERNRKMPVYFMPLTWRRSKKAQQPNETRENKGNSDVTATQQQPNSNPKHQPNTNPVQSEETQGLQGEQHIQQQPNISPQQQPPIYISIKDPLYKSRAKNISPDVLETKTGSSTRVNLDAVIQYFLDNGGSEEKAHDFFYHYESVDWKRPKSGPIQNWQALASKWIHNGAMDLLNQPNQQIGKFNHDKPKSNRQNIYDIAEQYSKVEHGEWEPANEK